MPIIIGLYLVWASLVGGLCISEDAKENKINEICTQKYQQIQDIKECKQVLRNYK